MKSFLQCYGVAIFTFWLFLAKAVSATPNVAAPPESWMVELKNLVTESRAIDQQCNTALSPALVLRRNTDLKQLLGEAHYKDKTLVEKSLKVLSEYPGLPANYQARWSRLLPKLPSDPRPESLEVLGSAINRLDGCAAFGYWIVWSKVLVSRGHFGFSKEEDKRLHGIAMRFLRHDLDGPIEADPFSLKIALLRSMLVAKIFTIKPPVEMELTAFEKKLKEAKKKLHADAEAFAVDPKSVDTMKEDAKHAAAEKWREGRYTLWLRELREVKPMLDQFRQLLDKVS